MAMNNLWFERALLPEGWARGVRLWLDGGRITRIETGTAAAPGEARHGVALAGMPNLHSHAFQYAMAGLTERRGPSADSFWTWRELMYRFVDRINPQDFEAIAAQAYVQMLEGGFTRVGEFHYLHHAPDGSRYANPAEHIERLAAAAADTGIGLTLLPVFYAHGDFGGQPPVHGQRRFVSSPEEFARLLEAARAVTGRLAGGVTGVAPHSLRAVTPDELAMVAGMAQDMAQNGPVHIHAAEQVAEVQACLAWSGQRPVEWLLNHAAVDHRWCLVHATHMTDAECSGLAASGAVAGLCPLTEANLGDGVFSARDYLAGGGRFGIGTDSNIRLDAAGELRLLEYGQRLVHRARNVLAGDAGRSTGRRLFELAVAGGSQALTGAAVALETGAPADFITLDVTHPALLEREDDALIDSWVFVAGREAIDEVWRDGRRLVAGGRHVQREGVARRYGACLRRLLG
jgi:formiminoglutamate deiminase